MRHLIVASSCLLVMSACVPSDSSRSNHPTTHDAGAKKDFASNNSSDGGNNNNPDFGGDPDPTTADDPTTCDEAATNHSYIGCDYWPTPVANGVLEDFDFAVIVANTGMNDAVVTVTGPNSVNTMVMVSAGTLEKIYLPWVDAINPPTASDRVYGEIPLTTSSMKAKNAAYHLVADHPVVVYQFNPLEYKAQGGPPGKKWTQCLEQVGDTADCYSVTNDASLLLPSTAMTGHYRVAGAFAHDGAGSYFSITGTVDGTHITIQAGSNTQTFAGGGIVALKAGATTTFTLDAGEVAEIVSDSGSTFSPAPASRELSGTLVQADQPVMVMQGDVCLTNGKGGITDQPTCDHVEETILPAETLGQKYVVTAPSGPNNATPNKQTVRIVGNVDGTNLTYTPAQSGAATTINAGQVIEIKNSNTNFIIEGDHEFAVAMVQSSAEVADPSNSGAMQKGDPSLSFAVAVEQYRLNYVFLAPDDYDTGFVDIVMPNGTNVTLDGAAVSGSPSSVGTDYQVIRIKLTATNGGIHTLVADQPVGIQVMGYGSYTSYQYPGGLNLKQIAPPPGPIG